MKKKRQRIKRNRSETRQNGQGIEKTESFFYMFLMFIIKAALGTGFFYLFFMNRVINFALANELEKVNIYTEVYIFVFASSLISAVLIISIFYAFNINLEYKKAVSFYFSARSILHNVIETFITAGIYIWLDNYYVFTNEFGVTKLEIYWYYFLAKVCIKLFINLLSRAIAITSSKYVERHSNLTPYIIAIILISLLFLFKFVYSYYYVQQTSIS